MSQPGGGRPGGRPPQLVRLALRLPYSDLSLSDKSGGPIELDDSIMDLALVLPFGIGPNEPRLLAVDDSGRLILSPTAGNQAGVFVVDDPGSTNARARVANDGDAQGSVPALAVLARGSIWNNAAWDRIRSAGAVNLAAQSGLGALIASPPGMWSVVSNPAAGVQATATRAAGAVGVRHIATGCIVSFGAIAAPAATALTWALRDGASGAGTILAQGQIAVPANAFATVQLTTGPMAVPGTAATAMTLEFSAALANLLEGVTLFGFDAS